MHITIMPVDIEVTKLACKDLMTVERNEADIMEGTHHDKMNKWLHLQDHMNTGLCAKYV